MNSKLDKVREKLPKKFNPDDFKEFLIEMGTRAGVDWKKVEEKAKKIKEAKGMEIKDIIKLLNDRIVLNEKNPNVYSYVIIEELKTIKAILEGRLEENHERKIQKQVG